MRFISRPFVMSKELGFPPHERIALQTSHARSRVSLRSKPQTEIELTSLHTFYSQPTSEGERARARDSRTWRDSNSELGASRRRLTVEKLDFRNHCDIVSRPGVSDLVVEMVEAQELEKRQVRILEKISSLEVRLSGGTKSESNGGLADGGLANGGSGGGCCLENGDAHGVKRESSGGETVEQRLSKILQAAGATEFIFRTVASDYYERTYEERRDLLGAASVDHLCKSIVMVNTQAHESVKDCSDRKNSKYYVVVVQYTARLNAEKVKSFVHSLNEGKIPKKRFNFRLAPEEESNRLTGFEHNAVTPVGMREDIPVILSDAIVKLSPRFFWLGGGEIALKLGMKTDDFISIVKPFITDCLY